MATSAVRAQAPLGGEIFYRALLSGDQVVPPVVSAGDGEFTARADEGGDSMEFELRVDGTGITQIHIHLGGPDENGGVAAFLFGPADPAQDGVTVSGTLTAADLLGPVAGDWDAFVAGLFAGAYVQVHTVDYPAGELRGQILVAVTTTGAGPTEEPTDDPIPVEPPGDIGDGVSPAALGDFLDDLAAAGVPVLLQEIAVIQPWIPVPSAGVLVLDGAEAEVYALSAPEAELAIGNISGDNAAFQPPANATVWRATELIVILREAPSHPAAERTLTGILGSPLLATIAGGVPPTGGTDTGAVEEPVVDEAGGSPGALPNTGSGGVADDPGAGPRAAWPAGIAVVVALLAGLAWVRVRPA